MYTLLAKLSLCLAVIAAAHGPKERLDAWNRLSASFGEETKIQWNEALQTPSRIEGTLSPPSAHSHPWIARQTMNNLKNVYGIRRPEQDLVIAGSGTLPSGGSYVIFRHLLYGKPVYGDELVAEIDPSGIVRRIYGTFHSDLEKKHFYRPLHAAVSDKQAVQTARAALSNPASRNLPATVSLMYLPSRKGNPLVYVVRFEGGSAGPDSTSRYVDIVMVHALTGHIIETP
ncbi:hypothetical protein N0M98_28285 [Paenibacillus doosanensis]|uniref:PepSY domain-containing protein n=1 Tax=Paenibacillus konkukensis TaxID=2020716 RepID=A0ABY4RGW9_9BACL|nr:MULTISPECIES: hypothetical protein [Paenibacillus]MCS7464014.1 hypothetical protein [Paenibacillus doosanensis]UQZ81390.1 hypothetical protein SK3146_00546 [Paenibacillus konkukensis]